MNETYLKLKASVLTGMKVEFLTDVPCYVTWDKNEISDNSVEQSTLLSHQYETTKEVEIYLTPISGELNEVQLTTFNSIAILEGEVKISPSSNAEIKIFQCQELLRKAVIINGTAVKSFTQAFKGCSLLEEITFINTNEKACFDCAFLDSVLINYEPKLPLISFSHVVQLALKHGIDLNLPGKITFLDDEKEAELKDLFNEDDTVEEYFEDELNGMLREVEIDVDVDTIDVDTEGNLKM